MVVTVSSEVERKLIALAAQQSVDPALLGGSLLEEMMRERGLLSPVNGFEGDVDEDPDSLSRAIAKMKSRTPDEVIAMRERVLSETPEPLPIPAGKTVFDMISGIRGDETDEEVFEALERLS